MAIEVIAPQRRRRQGRGIEANFARLKRHLADKNATGPHQRRHHRRQFPASARFASTSPVPGSKCASAIRFSSRWRDRRKRFTHVAQQQKFFGRNAVGMGGDLTLADKDVPLREKLAQMIVGAAIAEPEFEHRPVDAAHQARRHIEAGALRLQPSDEAVEPAHRWWIKRRSRPVRATACSPPSRRAIDCSPHLAGAPIPA